MAHEQGSVEAMLRESASAEQALIDSESEAERAFQRAETRYRKAIERLEIAEQRVQEQRKLFEQARALLDQRQHERAAGPVMRRVSVERPSLPRPARDDSRARSRRTLTTEPAPESAGSQNSDSEAPD